MPPPDPLARVGEEVAGEEGEGERRVHAIARHARLLELGGGRRGEGGGGKIGRVWAR